MIKYETNTSSIYLANKTFCEKIENSLKSLNIVCSGFCNSYGYDFEVNHIKNDLNYHLRFHKHQTSQNGIVVPIDAVDFSGIDITVKGLAKKVKVKYGKSAFRRFFTKKLFACMIPFPCYLEFNYSPDKVFLEFLIHIIQYEKISNLKLSNGNLVFEITGNSKTDVLTLISNIEKVVESWK